MRLFMLFPALLVACANPAPLPAKAIEMNRLGAAALASGDLQTAEARIAIAIEYGPKFTEAWVNLGLLELARGEVSKAKKDLGHARSLNPDLPAPHHALGLLEERMGRPKKAEAYYRAALAVDPGFAPARANLGRILFDAHRYDEAREQFLRLTEVRPSTLAGWLGLAESLLRLGRERDSDATVAYARATLGDTPELLLLVARQMLRRGAFDEAESILAPLTRDSDHLRRAEAWAWLGVARLGEGHRPSAEAAATESLMASPTEPVALYLKERLSAEARTP